MKIGRILLENCDRSLKMNDEHLFVRSPLETLQRYKDGVVRHLLLRYNGYAAEFAQLFRALDFVSS